MGTSKRRSVSDALWTSTRCERCIIAASPRCSRSTSLRSSRRDASNCRAGSRSSAFSRAFFYRLLPRSWFGACRFFQVLIVTPLAVVIGGDGELHALPRSVPMVSRGTAALHWWWPLLSLHRHRTFLQAETKLRRWRAWTFEASVSLSFSASLVCRL